MCERKYTHYKDHITHSFFIPFFQGVNTISLQLLRDLREEERGEERECLLWKIGVSQIHLGYFDVTLTWFLSVYVLGNLKVKY